MEDNAKILQYKNQKLREQVEVHKREKASLEEKVASLQAVQSNYEDNLLCINRLWGELNRDIAALASRASPVSGIKEEQQDDGLDSKALASAADPFLQRLVRGNDLAENQVLELTDEASDPKNVVEVALASKCEATKAALAGLLDIIDAGNKERLEQLVKLAPEETKAQVEELQGKLQTMQQELDGLRAVNLAAESRYSAVQDDLLKAQKEVINVSNELADKQEDCSILQRKLMTARAKAEEEERNNVAMASSSAAAVIEKTASPSSAGKAAAAEVPLMLAEERKRLEKRSLELEEERKMSRQLRLDLREAKLALQDETRYLKSKLHQDMVNRLNSLHAEFARHREMANQMRRELDMGAMREAELKFKVGEVEKVERLCHIMEARARDLEIQKSAAIKARDEAHSKLQALSEKIGQADTVGQLKVMVATLQKEISTLQANNTKLKASGERLESAVAEAEASRSAQEKLVAEKDLLVQKHKAAEEEAKQLLAVRHRLEDKAEDLRVFVEVLQSVENVPSDLADATARAQRAEEKVEELSKRLSEDELQKEKEAARVELKGKVEALESKEQDCVKLELERNSLLRQQKELKDHLEAQKAELEAYIKEIDVIGSAYEDMQAQNTALLQQMTERDALNHTLQSERLHLDQQAASLKEEQQICQSKVQLADSRVEVLQAREAELKGQVSRLQDEQGKGQKRLQELMAELEEVTRKCHKQEKAVEEKHLLVEAGQRQRAESQRAASEMGEKLEAERIKRQRLEEECKIFASRLERAKRKDDSSGANKELEGELGDMRTLLRCSVCHERQKNVIITKCFHMFCRPCIQRNLDTRLRKCPACGISFGSTDVKNIFFC